MQTFHGLESAEEVRVTVFNPPILARFIRIYPTSYNTYASMRFELYGRPLELDPPWDVGKKKRTSFVISQCERIRNSARLRTNSVFLLQNLCLTSGLDWFFLYLTDHGIIQSILPQCHCMIELFL